LRGPLLYMKTIHGGKAKNDKIDSQKIATLLRGGMLPKAYVYPAEMRATRDWLRRRTHLRRKRAELLAHVQNTNSPYNLPEIGKKIAYKANREGVAERFDDPAVQKTIEVDLDLITYDDQMLSDLEHLIIKRLSNTMPIPFTYDKLCRVLATSSVSSCSTKFTRSIASHGCRISLRIVDSSSVRKHPGANAWVLLGTRLGTLTSNGPFLKRLLCSFEGTSPDKSIWPGWRKSMTKAKRCVSFLKNSTGGLL